MPEQDEFNQEGLQAAFEAAKGAPAAESVVVDPPVETQPPVATPPPVETAEPEYKFNPSEWLKTSTEGLIDSEEKFKEFIPKIRNYDDLETKLKETESKIIPFKSKETEDLYRKVTEGDQNAIYQYYVEKNKDYKVMSDIDIVRESIAKEHPEWDAKGIELEMRGKFGKQLEPIDLSTIEEKDEDGRTTQEYRDAVAHNERAEENLLRLTIAARDARVQLIQKQSQLELPAPARQEAPPQSTAPSPEEIQARTAKWVSDVEATVPNLPPIKYAINDKEVEYSYTQEQQQEFTERMKSFNIAGFAKERGWLNEDGTTNAKALSEDVRWLLDREKIVKSFGTQMDTLATKEALKKIKNIPNESTNTIENDPEPGSLAEAWGRARQEAGW